MGSSSRNLYAGIGEGQSTSRLPLFDGTNYSYWKERMRIYIRSTNFQLWLVIKNGEEIPMKKVGETTVPKTENEFDAEDIKKIENYAKAINMLYCAVNPDDYRKISCCTTAKEMWDKLEVTYEGTDQVREAKIDFLTQEYEMFRMKEGIGEGQSTSRPPLFDGTNYTYWKERMRIYIRSTNFQLWLVIKNGKETPMKKVGEKLVTKTEDEFDAEDIKKVENYAKAINMLYCTVNPDDYRKISCCTTAKEMWDKLEVTYEGTDQVREAKIDFLTQEYEMFRMKEGEKIDDMFDRFSKIINDLHALKKTYANKDLVRKILRSLTPEWRSKADAIYESIGVSNVTIDGLRDNLKTYESTILTPSLDEQKKKGIALKATKETVEEVSSDDDNEFGLVIKKFHKFMKKEFERKGRKHDGPPKCYGCGEIGHIKPRCPKGKNGKDKPGFKKQRAYISWGGDQEEDEAANLYLMAHEDHVDKVQEVCLKASSVLWYLDSGCSKHMTGDASKFLQIKPAKGGNVVFGDNSKGKIIGIGSVDSLERIHVEDDEENTGIYTNTQPQIGKMPQATTQSEEENQEEEEEQEEHEEEATELPIAWRTNKNHPLDQKTKASKKKAAAEPSSAAPPPFPYLDGSFLEFGSEEELTRFLTYFAKRPISPPCVLPELFPQQKGYHDLDNQLKESGLWPFVSKSRTSFNPAFVRAFYSNLRRDGDIIRSSINLYDIEIDLPTFARIAGLPIRGDDIATYGGDDWILNNEAVVIRELGITNLIRHSGASTIHSAPLDKRLLLCIITRILRPRDSSHTSLFNEDLKAIHAIIHGASINWAKFVMIHMADCASIATSGACRTPSSTFRKKSGDRDNAGPSRAPALAPAPAKANLQSIADTLNRLTITVDGMGQYLERMDGTLQRQHHDMTAFFRGINFVPPPFDSTILNQNFEGEDEDDDSYAPSSSPDEADFEDAVDGDPMDEEDDDEDEDADSWTLLTFYLI
ncbi:unnamed protein product [Cuscuta campestris]|uniref:CCHC-type domain-containing protein n=1 Tax=Cuscuta campestris TaxID=132261 RepID=A0A484L757_9ASTE|nr:unnamed protein product [Cuscuta campestris]